MFDDNSLPALGGTATEMSDWVGKLEAKPIKGISFYNNFRLDNADFEARRMDTGLVLGDTLKTNLQLSHTLLDGGPEEVHAKGRYVFNDEHSVEAEMRRDLKDGGKMLLSEASYIYTHQCYKVSFTTRRRGFENRNVPPSTSYLVNLELLTLGRDRD